MKKIISCLFGSVLLVSLLSCSLGGERKVKKKLTDTTWSKAETIYAPKYSHVLSFTKDTYSYTYHKDAIGESEAEDRSSTGSWSYLDSKEVSWTGDWNFHHKYTYYIVTLSDFYANNDDAYFCFELDSNAGYLCHDEPTGSSYLTEQMLVLQDE